MAVSPNGSKIFILDGAAYQQVRIFDNNSGDSISTFGSAGGYINNSSVNDYKFYFSDSATGLSKPFVAFQSDSSFWLGDVGNERVQHYNASGTFINRIMCLPHCYSTVVDRNNPNRVFNEYLEFYVDYTKPLASHNGSWTLVNNWRRGIKANYFQSDKLRIFIQLITLSNNRTYALLDEYVNGIRKPEVVELVPNANIRYTGVKLQDFAHDIIGQDGSLRRIISSRNIGDSGYWQVQTLNRFDSKNNPVWNSSQKIAWIPKITANDPAFSNISSPAVTSGGYNIIFNAEKDNKGYHLGAIKTGTNQYIWKTSKATKSTYTGPMPKDGTFDIGNNVEYAGGGVYAMEKNIFWNYHGEFWKNSQTNIWNHYHESGLMVSQFGIVLPEAEALEKEAYAKGAGNVFSSTLLKVGNDYYIYHNDESVHGGVHRWKISGLNSIIEIVKKKHFNPDLPEYQNFCVTGKNDAYANIVDPETRRIKAVNKKDVFDKVYYGIVTNVNTITSTKPEIMETIQRINEIPVSKKMIKKLHLGINEEAYHYKDMVKKTWENAEFTSNENKIKYDLNEWSDDSDDEIPEARRKLIKECSKLLNDIKSKSHLFKKKDIEV
jgi:hypothetical protein